MKQLLRWWHQQRHQRKHRKCLTRLIVDLKRQKKVQLQALREDFEKLNKKSNKIDSDYFTKVISLMHQMRVNMVKIMNLMVHKIKILISEVMAEAEEEVVEDIQIGGIIMQTHNVIIVESIIILLQIVHNTNLKTKMSTLLK